MGRREAALDEGLDEHAALDLRDLDQLVVAGGAGRMLLVSSRRRVVAIRAGAAATATAAAAATAADLVAAPHGDAGLGEGAAPHAVREALEHAGDDDLLGGPGPDAGDDGDLVVDDKGLELVAVLAEEGVAHELLDVDGPPLEAHRVRVRRDERLVRVERRQHDVGREVRRERHPRGDGDVVALGRSHGFSKARFSPDDGVVALRRKHLVVRWLAVPEMQPAKGGMAKTATLFLAICLSRGILFPQEIAADQKEKDRYTADGCWIRR